MFEDYAQEEEAERYAVAQEATKNYKPPMTSYKELDVYGVMGGADMGDKRQLSVCNSNLYYALQCMTYLYEKPFNAARRWEFLQINAVVSDNSKQFNPKAKFLMDLTETGALAGTNDGHWNKWLLYLTAYCMLLNEDKLDNWFDSDTSLPSLSQGVQYQAVDPQRYNAAGRQIYNPSEFQEWTIWWTKTMGRPAPNTSPIPWISNDSPATLVQALMEERGVVDHVQMETPEQEVQKIQIQIKPLKVSKKKGAGVPGSSAMHSATRPRLQPTITKGRKEQAGLT